MFEVFFEINRTLLEMRDLMVKMEKHLEDLTMPPDLKAWSKRRKITVLTNEEDQENILFAKKCIVDGKDDDYIFDNLPYKSSGSDRKYFGHQMKYMRGNNETKED